MPKSVATASFTHEIHPDDTGGDKIRLIYWMSLFVVPYMEERSPGEKSNTRGRITGRTSAVLSISYCQIDHPPLWKIQLSNNCHVIVIHGTSITYLSDSHIYASFKNCERRQKLSRTLRWFVTLSVWFKFSNKCYLMILSRGAVGLVSAANCQQLHLFPITHKAGSRTLPPL